MKPLSRVQVPSSQSTYHADVVRTRNLISQEALYDTMERRSRKENDIGACIVPACTALIADRLRTRHSSLNCNTITYSTDLIRLMNRDDHRDQASTCFPLIYTFAYFYDFAGRFMSRATLQVEATSDNNHSINNLKGRSDFIGNHHRVANPPMLPEVNIAPAN